MGSFSFSKTERLLNRGDFVNLNRLGKRYYTEHFKLIFMENDLGITRLGITVSKKIGNAVTRNKVKRLIREYFRLHKALFPEGCDVVVSARKNAGDLDFWKITRELGDVVPDKSCRSCI